MTKKRSKESLINQVIIVGYVDGGVVSGVTRDGGLACSFSIDSVDSGQKTTSIRVNAYGQLAEQCVDSVSHGNYCLVIGELMNRPGRFGNLTEVRAKKVESFLSQDRESLENGDVESEE